MSQGTISDLFVYPIKSLGGISVSSVKLNGFGFEMDREWMLVDETGLAYTQRDHPQLALFETEIHGQGVLVRKGTDEILIPLGDDGNSQVQSVQMWGVNFKGQNSNREIDTWFSERLDQSLRLVRNYKPEPRIDTRDATAKIRFVDACQCLVIGDAALKELNERCPEKIPMNRFRPNIVVENIESHAEDTWASFSIADAHFKRVKSCARCNVTTIDQTTAQKSKEPLKTLATYRNWDQRIWFGSYFTHINPASHQLNVGDNIKAHKAH